MSIATRKRKSRIVRLPKKITNKFNINDVIFFMFDNVVQSGKVSTIWEKKADENSLGIHYRVDVDGRYLDVPEPAAFGTKQELLNSL